MRERDGDREREGEREQTIAWHEDFSKPYSLLMT